MCLEYLFIQLEERVDRLYSSPNEVKNLTAAIFLILFSTVTIDKLQTYLKYHSLDIAEHIRNFFLHTLVAVMSDLQRRNLLVILFLAVYCSTGNKYPAKKDPTARVRLFQCKIFKYIRFCSTNLMALFNISYSKCIQK